MTSDERLERLENTLAALIRQSVLVTREAPTELDCSDRTLLEDFPAGVITVNPVTGVIS